MTGRQDGRQLVSAFFGHLAAGRRAQARATWAPDAVWHVAGSHEYAGEHPIDDYLDALTGWYGRYPDYRAARLETHALAAEFVVTYVRSEGGPKPSSATGLLIHKVGDGLLLEGWGLPYDGNHPF